MSGGPWRLDKHQTSRRADDLFIFPLPFPNPMPARFRDYAGMQCRRDKCLHWDDRSKSESASRIESEKGRGQAAAEGETWTGPDKLYSQPAPISRLGPRMIGSGANKPTSTV